jgi:UDP-N-acetylmuramyl pentapeptide synthase
MKSTQFFEAADAAAAALADEVRAGDLVLVKGSRSVETDKVIKALRDRFPLVGEDQAT